MATSESIPALLETLEADEMYRVSENDINYLGYYYLENEQPLIANQIKLQPEVIDVEGALAALRKSWLQE